MKKWMKASLVVVPLVLGTSVYAYADQQSTNQATIQIQEAQPVQNVTASAQPVSPLSEIPNPFVVNKAQIQQQLANQQQGQSTTGTQTSTTLTIDQIKHLNIQVKTDRGDLKIEYHLEGNGTPRLNGEVGDIKLHLSGDKAKEYMNQLLTNWDLLSTLQLVLNNPNTNVNLKPILPLNKFELQTTDGRTLNFDDHKLKVELEKLKEHQEKPDAEKDEKPEVQAKAVAPGLTKHEDNGKHNGQEKVEKEKKHGEHDQDDDDQGEDD